LYLTLCLDEKNPQHVKYLTFITAISIVKTLSKLKIQSSIKWPNDILIKKRKVCGILTENIFGKNNVVLVGIGLNVNQKSFPVMERIPTSLFLEAKREFDIQKVLVIFLDYFERYYVLYQREDFPTIRKLWKMHANTIGKKVTIRTMKETMKGKAIDIDKECNLLIKKGSEVRKITEGDVFY
jgi:BirA family transcriptional regulator, biotin operon repressor / biotin---[acetyl-CoA-carboxylase] ligase